MDDTEERMDDMDKAIAREVFGLSEGQIEAWPFGVPEFSTNGHDARGVVNRLYSFDRHREAFDRHLARLIPYLHGGLCEQLLVCTPEDICEAALMAVRECGALEPICTSGRNELASAADREARVRDDALPVHYEI